MAGLFDCLRIRLRSFEGRVLVAKDRKEESSRDCNDDGGARLETADARDDERDSIERRVDDNGIGAIAPHDSLVARWRRCRLVRVMRMRWMFWFVWFVDSGDVWPELETGDCCDRMTGSITTMRVLAVLGNQTIRRRMVAWVDVRGELDERATRKTGLASDSGDVCMVRELGGCRSRI
jgi:hypothetical protein